MGNLDFKKLGKLKTLGKMVVIFKLQLDFLATQNPKKK